MILIAALFVSITATAHGAGPLPPTPAPVTQLYSLHGSLSRYEPARLTDGSITIRVDAASPNASSSIGQTLTFRVTAATTVVIPGGLGKAATGWIRILGSSLLTPAALAAKVPSMVLVDRVATLPVSRI